MKHVKIQSKEEIEDQYKKHPIDIREKLRIQHQLSLKDNRYKVVNLRRFDKEESDNLTIVDIETDKKKGSEEAKDESKYVYDLYYMPSEDASELNIEEVE